MFERACVLPRRLPCAQQQERSRMGPERPMRVENTEGQRERSEKERVTKSRAEEIAQARPAYVTVDFCEGGVCATACGC